MSTAKADPAVDAWKTILELVGWGANRVPRFPIVAMELDLSPKQLGVLWRLEPDGDGLPMGAVAESLYCDASYVTEMVDRLEERSLIERRPDPRDRRVKLIALTPAGEKLRARALEMLYTPPAGFTALATDERATLARLLAKAAREPGDA
jgi:MarR family transcriptional regulator, organic hydroperoxide resistance regulator